MTHYQEAGDEAPSSSRSSAASISATAGACGCPERPAFAPAMAARTWSGAAGRNRASPRAEKQLCGAARAVRPVEALTPPPRTGRAGPAGHATERGHAVGSNARSRPASIRSSKRCGCEWLPRERLEPSSHIQIRRAWRIWWFRVGRIAARRRVRARPRPRPAEHRDTARPCGACTPQPALGLEGDREPDVGAPAKLALHARRSRCRTAGWSSLAMCRTGAVFHS